MNLIRPDNAEKRGFARLQPCMTRRLIFVEWLCIRLTRIYSPWHMSDRKRKASCVTRTYETRWGKSESLCSATHYWPTIWPAVSTPHAALPQPSQTADWSTSLARYYMFFFTPGWRFMLYSFHLLSLFDLSFPPRATFCVRLLIRTKFCVGVCLPAYFSAYLGSCSVWLHGKRVPARDKMAHAHWRCVTNSSGQPRSLYLWHHALWNMNGRIEMHNFLSFLKQRDHQMQQW